MIAFLHTSEIHINNFEKLVRKHDKNVIIKHYVNENLLKTALADGQTDSVSFKNEIERIKQEKPRLLICTCSTYGEESDKDKTIHRIDRPIAEYLVQHYNKIALAFTANSTRKISENLLKKTAKKLHKNIEIVRCDCSKSWPYFEQGALEKYEQSIAKNIKQIADKVDVIFLAQASMNGAKAHVGHLEKEVVSSAEYGIQMYMKKYQTLKQ